MSLVVRAAGDPTALVPAMRAAVQELDPELPADFRTLDDIVASSLDGRRFALVLLGVFAVVALLLAVTGIYGVTAYSVAQRTHEFGIRMALGARPRTVLAMVMREAARLALGGVAIGALAALALTRLIASWLVGVGASDPATFALVALALAAAALLASWVPARRAVRVDPMAALRSE
jgi:putative ABC transport system permease protein